MSAWHIEIGSWWIGRGYRIIPCQPGSKQIVAGFGAHPDKQRISTIEGLERWWAHAPQSNMAVVCPDEVWIIDFDDPSLYDTWAEMNPEGARSYTETTALRGGKHVFGLMGVPKGLKYRGGIEVKNCCMVAPSQVRDECGELRSYERGRGEIIELDAARVLRDLTAPNSPTAYLMTLRERDEARSSAVSSRLEAVKQHFTVLDILRRYRTDVPITGRGRWLMTRCPFHKGGAEARPSFAIDTERGYWKCHACGLHGDVINLYALLQHISNAEAIRRMVEVMR